MPGAVAGVCRAVEDAAAGADPPAMAAAWLPPAPAATTVPRAGAPDGPEPPPGAPGLAPVGAAPGTELSGDTANPSLAVADGGCPCTWTVDPHAVARSAMCAPSMVVRQWRGKPPSGGRGRG